MAADWTLRDLIPEGLVDGRELVARGRQLGDQVAVGTSAFCRAHGFGNELDYKLAMARQGRTMTALTIGLADWPDTRRGLEHIFRECQDRGFYVDRFILALDRRMGLPVEMRAAAIKETGPLLADAAEWLEVAQSVEIQPHMGDMMIGSPASVDNTRRALEAGVNYIGNLSQFAWKYQGWPGTDADQMAEVVTALGLMASKSNDGAVVHSYLDDGFPAQFSDYSSYVGWAQFERYVVETVIGAQLGHAYGGLSHDPVTKMAVALAVETHRPATVCSSFYYSNTTRYTTDVERNLGLLAVDLLHLMLADRKARAGAAMMPVPATEAVRIPSPQEIVTAQTIARDVAGRVDDVFPLVDWRTVDTRVAELVAQGDRFYNNLMQGMADIGVDVDDPLQLLLAVRRIGGHEIEKAYGVGTRTEDPAYDGYKPVIPTDTLRDFLAERARVRSAVRPSGWTLNRSHTALVGSSDVHEMGMRLVIDAVEALGIKPFVAGVGVDADELAQAALEREATVLLVSTHNGMALSYATELLRELEARGMAPQVVFGGRLNQDVEGQDMPVDVTDELVALGIDVCRDAADLATIIRNG